VALAIKKHRRGAARIGRIDRVQLFEIEAAGWSRLAHSEADDFLKSHRHEVTEAHRQRDVVIAGRILSRAFGIGLRAAIV